MTSTPVDALDRAILVELRDDGRASWRELGERVGLGPTATADRVKRLVDAGVISGFTATLDPAALGIGLRAVVDVRLSSGADAERFEDRLAATPEVQAAFHLTGPFDYQLLLSCPDVKRLDELLRGWKDTAGVDESNTRIVLAEIDLRSSRRSASPRRPPHAVRRHGTARPR